MSQTQPLSTTHPRGDFGGSVVDLRDADGPSSSTSTAMSIDPLASTAASSRPTSSPRRRRRLVVAGVLVLVGLFLAELLVGFATHEARQRHLAYEMTQSTTEVGAGHALLNLQIPSISVNEIVVEGAYASELRSAPGRVEGSAAVGAKGNTVILGRRQRFGGPFGRLDELEEGATIAVKTRDGEVRLYGVDSVERVASSSRAPVERTEEERLTLITSGRGLLPDDRLVVTASPREGSTPSDAERDDGTELSSSAMDVRPTGLAPGGLVVWALIAVLFAVLVIAGRQLGRRYSTSVTIVALAPVGALLAVVLLYSVDIVLPATL